MKKLCVLPIMLCVLTGCRSSSSLETASTPVDTTQVVEDKLLTNVESYSKEVDPIEHPANDTGVVANIGDDFCATKRIVLNTQYIKPQLDLNTLYTTALARGEVNTYRTNNLAEAILVLVKKDDVKKYTISAIFTNQIPYYESELDRTGVNYEAYLCTSEDSVDLTEELKQWFEDLKIDPSYGQVRFVKPQSGSSQLF